MSFAICSASSRVGAKTTARGRLGSARRAFATKGIPNANVFPDPVGARPQISFPASASVNVAAWISNGSVMPDLARARQINSGTPS